MNITLYAYLNIANPMVAWEVAIGRIRSACDATKENFGISVWAYSLLRRLTKAGLDQRFINELSLEAVRQKTESDAVSRMTGVYFFESERDAHAAVERWGIRNRKDVISAVNFSANRVTMVDSEWITSYLASEDQDWMPKYWQGKTLGVQPLTEVIASGIGVVQSQELRIRAYQSILERWPTSTPLLAMACCAFKEYKLEDIALIKPAITATNGVVSGGHYIDIRDLSVREAEVINSVDACKRRGELPFVVNSTDGDTFFTLPDMSDMDFEVSSANAAKLLGHIHDAALHKS